MITFLQLVFIALALAPPAVCQNSLLAWGYECRQSKCFKVLLQAGHKVQSQSVCRMLCGDDIGTLWPKPTGIVRKGNHVVMIDKKKIRFQTPPNLKSEKLWRMVETRFRGQINNKCGDSIPLPEEKLLVIRFKVKEGVEEGKLPRLTYDTDESYSLRISEETEEILVDINAKTFFGARHGLETLSQLILYDYLKECLQMIADTEINDAPAYKHRGILLDTARNYFSVKSIKRTINGMAMSKMNVFHWHMIDSNSFPLVINSHPDFHNLGAYYPHHIYTRADIADILEYALARGVRVIPEFDGPAHVGEGWQNTNMVACFNAQPWRDYCYQPPCGQLDPTIEALYEILEDIYREIFEAFNPDVFHMGGDSVTMSCWNSSAAIRDWMLSRKWRLQNSDFLKLWKYFQTNALKRVDKVANNTNTSIILWSTELTQVKYLNKSRYIIQSYYDDAQVKKLLKKGFRLISSNKNLFIDGEISAWTADRAEVTGWQKLYEHRLDRIFGGQNKLILGSEAAVFTERIDEFSLDAILWPKASALGERLWSNPRHGWHKALSRFSMHRSWLTENGIHAGPLQPEWCFLNEKECPKDAYD